MRGSAARHRAPTATAALLACVGAAIAIAFAGGAGHTKPARAPASPLAAPLSRFPGVPDQDYSAHVVLLPAGRGVWKSPQGWERPVALVVVANGRGRIRRRRCGGTLTGPGFRVVIDTCRHGDVRRVRVRYRASRPLRLTYRAEPGGSSSPVA